MSGGRSRPGHRSAGPTLKDVAAIAGVSYRTVSNVINGGAAVSAATREKVEAAAAELGYRPQLAARQLRAGRSNLLTLSVPFLSLPYFAQLAHAIVSAAERVGYDVVVDETHGDPERELRAASGYGTLLTDGVLLSPMSLDDGQLAEARRRARPVPLVVLGERIRGARVDRVVVDSVLSSRDATAHLISSGRRSLGFLGAVPDASIGAAAADLRLEGFRLALREAGLEPDPRQLLEVSSWDPASPDGDYSREEGHARVLALLERGPLEIDALVCANDLLAIGALRAFREAGVAVPDRVAVVGWDDSPESAFAAPALTSIAPDLHEIARLAVASVLRLVEDPASPPRVEQAPYRLVARASAP
ncbi:DNA-binding LacI/PurR family transcriptional regulator [Agromyces terreus]|uniref:DNA-binding LacI/PurR family transcriptional regulator n=1 Tax=Agromyces terreus TaxID=424795 RepID=A0A9X2KDU9_9MICO|nr:LacI family DNA-binding transcriptional regulator [Agromyces terreus]MCP2369957.1 DNA-binding LacI/PurR family transcriptional regulator [Agromyces terreus]